MANPARQFRSLRSLLIKHHDSVYGRGVLWSRRGSGGYWFGPSLPTEGGASVATPPPFSIPATLPAKLSDGLGTGDVLVAVSGFWRTDRIEISEIHPGRLDASNFRIQLSGSVDSGSLMEAIEEHRDAWGVYAYSAARKGFGASVSAVKMSEGLANAITAARSRVDIQLNLVLGNEVFSPGWSL